MSKRNVPPWLVGVAEADGPIYLAITDAIAAAIATDELKKGERLPTQRALAEALGVDLTTVTRAYAEARRRGLLQATVGRGTFVRTREPLQAASADAPSTHASAGAVDLSMNMPPPIDAPSVRDLIGQGFADLLARSDAAQLSTYRTGAGTEAERSAGALWLRPTLGNVDPERILISPGAQPALLAVLASTMSAGDVVLTGQHIYPGFHSAAGQLGVRLVPVACDAEGMVPEAVSEACRGAPRPRGLYCVPTIDNPTTVTMPLARRHAIAEIAERHGLIVIEDDAYGRLPSEPIAAITALAPGIGFHIATLSKTLSPALRIAFVMAPDLRQAARLSAHLRASILMCSPLLSGLVTSWIEDGTAELLALALRREAAARQRIAREVLPEGSFDAHPEGLHLWLHLPAHWDRLSFVAHLQRQNGLAVVPSDAFAIGDHRAPAAEAARISLGAAAGRDKLRSALHVVTKALEGDVPAQYAEIV